MSISQKMESENSIIDDEKIIKKAYSRSNSFLNFVPMGIPFIIANCASAKWVLAYGVAMIFIQLTEISAKLHDLCVRARRMNILIEKDANKKE